MIGNTIKIAAFILVTFNGLTIMSQPSEDVTRMTEWLTGTFTSEEQAARDGSFRELEIHMVPIWNNADDSKVWIYAEQATMENKDKPYRQRVFRIEQISEDVIVADVFILPNPAEFIGAWESPIVFEKLTPSDLQEKQGCALYFNYDGFANYEGSTMDDHCKSDYKGAKYSTSTWVVTPDKVLTWERGFNEKGKQVWGAEKGSYEFKKISN